MRGQPAYLAQCGPRYLGSAWFVFGAAVRLMPVHDVMLVNETVDGVNQVGHPCIPAHLTVSIHLYTDLPLYFQGIGNGTIFHAA